VLILLAFLSSRTFTSLGRNVFTVLSVHNVLEINVDDDEELLSMFSMKLSDVVDRTFCRSPRLRFTSFRCCCRVGWRVFSSS